MDPFTLIIAAIGLGINAVGAGVNAFGQWSAGQEQKRINYANAAIADQAAADARQRGTEQAARIRGTGDRLESAQVNTYAANGFDVGSESAQATIEGSRRIVQRDIETVRLNASREAWGFSKQAENMRRGGDAAASAGFFNAAGTAVAGAGQTLLGANDLAAKWGLTNPRKRS